MADPPRPQLLPLPAFAGTARTGPVPYELDAKIVESMERAAREADDEVAELLAVPVKPGLLERWKSLGGFVPDPLKGSARRSRSSERRVIG